MEDAGRLEIAGVYGHRDSFWVKDRDHEVGHVHDKQQAEWVAGEAVNDATTTGL